MDLPAFLRSRRSALRLSLRQVARSVGVDPAYLSRVETGQVPASDDLLSGLSRVLDVSPDELSLRAGRVPSSLRPIVEREPSRVTYAIRDISTMLLAEPSDPPGPTAHLPATSEDQLYGRVAQIIEAAHRQVARSVNTAMVHAYWFIGREIVEHEQGGQERAGYGEKLLRRLASRLAKQYGKGFSYPNVKRMRQFYQTFPAGSALKQKGSALVSLSGQRNPPLFPPDLSWMHYCILMRVKDETARRFYEIEAASENWSYRELERQVAALLFERLAASRDKEAVRALGEVGQSVSRPRDVLKDPFVLEFLDLQKDPRWLEADLEKAIMDRLQDFLLELGKGFCFVGRQKRLTLEGDHFYVDLVFYNRLLRCFVLIDLKLGKLTHQDLGQMQMYVHYYDRFQRAEGEAPTVGILLCSEKNDAMVRITLPEGEAQIHAASYLRYLPSEQELREQVRIERERIEQVIRLRGEE